MVEDTIIRLFPKLKFSTAEGASEALRDYLELIGKEVYEAEEYTSRYQVALPLARHVLDLNSRDIMALTVELVGTYHQEGRISTRWSFPPDELLLTQQPKSLFNKLIGKHFDANKELHPNLHAAYKALQKQYPSSVLPTLVNKLFRITHSKAHEDKEMKAKKVVEFKTFMLKVAKGLPEGTPLRVLVETHKPK